MASYTVVLPSIWQPWTDLCVESMDHDFASHVVVVDNTVDNRGVSRSWNEGVRTMHARGDDWLVLLSAAIRFGPPGGMDFVAHLDTALDDAWAVEAGECPRQPGHGFGWHLIGFPSSTFDRVGTFDENFFAYYEDNDFGQRIRCATSWQPGPDPIWQKVPVDADMAGYAHGVRLAGVRSDPNVAVAYYRRKWGGPPSCEEYRTPFNDGHDLSWWPTPIPYRQPST